MATTAHAVFDAIRAKLEAISGLTESPVRDILQAPTQASAAWFTVLPAEDLKDFTPDAADEAVRTLRLAVQVLAFHRPKAYAAKYGALLDLADTIVDTLDTRGAFTSPAFTVLEADDGRAIEAVSDSSLLLTIGLDARYIHLQT